jgi:hypothetical protein
MKDKYAIKDEYDIGRQGAWITTFTGKQFWPLDPLADDIDIRDIARSLSMQCRFIGHSKGFYSVAEHSLHIAGWLTPEFALWGLLHDAAEAYLGDLARPIKPYLTGYVEAEAKIMKAIVQRFNLDPIEAPKEVKEADNRIVFDERAALLAPPPEPWNFELEPLGVQIKCLSPEIAEREFLRNFTVFGGR